MKIILDQDALFDNNKAASFNRDIFAKSKTVVINVMSSPGAGKTTLLEKTVSALSNEFRIGVIEGDLATERDAERIRAVGAKAIQIETNGICHLDARMVSKALPEFDLDEIDLLFIENVGNLVCPSKFDLGQEHQVVILSIPEGNDKIVKYPVMFRVAELVILNKIDLLPYLDFDIEQAKKDLQGVNPKSEFIQVSSKSDEGMESWFDWIRSLFER